MRSRLGRSPEHDVEAGGKLADLRFLDGFEIDDHRLASFLVANAAQDAVALVRRLALDVALGGELLLAFSLDGEMNVPRATGIERRFDRAKVILARRAGQKTAEALEVLVERLAVAAARVQVDPVVVDLPDFDQGIAKGFAARVQDSPAEVRDLADGRRDFVVDDQQIVVGIERQLVRIKGPFGLRRGQRQLFGEGAASGEASRPEGDSAEKAASR